MTGKQLKQELSSRGIMQAWLARKLGVAKSTVTNWVNGVHDIPDRYHTEIKSLLSR